MGKIKTVSVRLDMKKGFIIRPERVTKTDNSPVIFSGSYPEAKRLTDMLNKQFEIH